MLDNDRSARVCGRIGMRLLGITDRWYPEPSLMFWGRRAAGPRGVDRARRTDRARIGRPVAELVPARQGRCAGDRSSAERHSLSGCATRDPVARRRLPPPTHP
jgi:hypothetical protein